MKAMTGYAVMGTIKRMVTIGGAGIGLMLAGMTGAHATAPPLTNHQFGLHFSSNHSVTDAYLLTGGATLNADGSVSFTGSYAAAPNWTWLPVSGKETPGTGGGWSITWTAGSGYNSTTFTGAIQAEGGGTDFMTGSRNVSGYYYLYPYGYFFYNSGPFPVCATGFVQPN